ncbi:paraquat-inducible protein A [Salinisphaera sp. USBA-960]|nr:paraquat-inducible protein A [Salifodinibacter halophilus]NNC27105.1 paraquat-inducible protein A [Salifodinibacter halophilus]
MNSKPQHAEAVTDTATLLCDECDWMSRVPVRYSGQRAHCPRCGHHLTGPAQPTLQAPAAWAVAALVLLGLAFAFPFIGFSSHGIGHVMRFGDTVGALTAHGYALIAFVLIVTTVVVPGLYALGLGYVVAGVHVGLRLPGMGVTARLLRRLEPWMMPDVLIVGVLVSLIKIVGMADVHLDAAFVLYCGYALALLRSTMLVDWPAVWAAIAPRVSAAAATPGATGAAQAATACAGCGLPIDDGFRGRCPRCGKRQRAAVVDRRQLTGALLVTSALLYIPANIYPVMVIEQLGNQQPQTIAAGILHLVHAGDWPIATVIFVASIIVPIAKIVALAWLCLVSCYKPRAPLMYTQLYRVTEKIGRWSMIDVFVVAMLATLVQTDGLMSVTPGPGIAAFASVVILTMVAALTFDSRTLWPQVSAAASPCFVVIANDQRQALRPVDCRR